MRNPKAILWVLPEPPQNPGIGGPLRMHWIIRGVREALPGTKHIGVSAYGTYFKEGVTRSTDLFDELHWVDAHFEAGSVEHHAVELFKKLEPYNFAYAATWWANFLQPLLRKCVDVLDAHPEIEVVHLDHLNLAPLAVWLRRYTKAPIALTAHNTYTLLAGAEGNTGSVSERLSRRMIGLAATAAHLTPLVWYSKNRDLMSRAALKLSEKVPLAPHSKRIATAMDAWYTAKADLVLCMSEQEATLLRQMGNRTFVAPNGASARNLEPVVEARAKLADSPTRVPIFGFVGAAGYPPYQEACRLMLEAFTATPELGRLRLVGFEMGKWVGPSPAFTACPNATLVDSPPDIRPYLMDLDAMVMPIFSGGGTRLKVVESVFAGVPMVASKKAVEGLHLEPERDYALIEDATPEAVGRAVQRFLAERDRYAERVRALRQEWLDRYDWLSIGARVARELSVLVEDVSNWKPRLLRRAPSTPETRA